MVINYKEDNSEIIYSSCFVNIQNNTLFKPITLCPRRNSDPDIHRGGTSFRLQPPLSSQLSPTKRAPVIPRHEKAEARIDSRGPSRHLEYDQSHALERTTNRSSRDDRATVNHRREDRRTEAHPYRRKQSEDNRSTWIRKEDIKAKAIIDHRHDLIPKQITASQPAKKRLVQSHTEAASYRPKATPLVETTKDMETKATRSEEVQSNSKEIPHPHSVLRRSKAIPKLTPSHHSPMDEDKNNDELVMTEETNVAYMIVPSVRISPRRKDTTREKLLRKTF